MHHNKCNNYPDNTPNKTRVQLFIASFERPTYLREALLSALDQNVEGVEIIVSDNSLSDDVQIMIAKEFPRVNYIRRKPSVPACEHGALLFSESTSEFAIYFHDDDVMAPGYIKTLLKVMEDHPELAAASCNSWTIRNNKQILLPRMGKLSSNMKLEKVEDLLAVYMDFAEVILPAPFSAYIYRRKSIDGLLVDQRDAGKYSDAAFLMKVIKRGPVVWLAEPLMLYREHESNDSATENVGDRLRLLRFVYTHSTISRNNRLVESYRFKFWFHWWQKGKCGPHRSTPWRDKIVRKFLIASAIHLFFTHAGFRVKFWAKIKRSIQTVFNRF